MIEAQAATDYVTQVQSVLKLEHWLIDVEVVPLDDVLGRCIIGYGRHAATIQLAEQSDQHGREDFRDTVVHELMHICLDRFTRDTETLENVLGGPLFDVFRNVHRNTLEMTIDSITGILGPFVALPPDDVSDSWGPIEDPGVSVKGVQVSFDTMASDGWGAVEQDSPRIFQPGTYDPDCDAAHGDVIQLQGIELYPGELLGIIQRSGANWCISKTDNGSVYRIYVDMDRDVFLNQFDVTFERTLEGVRNAIVRIAKQISRWGWKQATPADEDAVAETVKDRLPGIGTQPIKPTQPTRRRKPKSSVPDSDV